MHSYYCKGPEDCACMIHTCYDYRGDCKDCGQKAVGDNPN